MKIYRTALAIIATLAPLAAAQTSATPPPPVKAPAQPAPAPSLQLHTLGAATQADPFPAVNPASFTADSPSVATVDSYLHAMLGYDPNRIWRVMSIQQTQAAGVSKVTALVSERSPNAKTLRTTFFVLPDGRHLIAPDASGLSPFGAKPFAEARELLQAKAGGPARGAAEKDLMFVEFADLQCPRCKEAEATMAQLAKDFPKARLVYESFPLNDIHPYAGQAALYGACVADKSSEAFFTYASAVYDSQAALVPETYQATLNAAVAKAGMDPLAVAACAATDTAKSAVSASTALGAGLGVDQTPTLVVNGRLLPLTGIPYATLKALIAFQAAQDGVTGVSPSSFSLQPR